jgi:formamidopyrimidine-DNA glycosylase
MPELPEVETIRRGLSESLLPGAVVSRVELRRKDLRVPIPPLARRALNGKSIAEIRRRAKFLLLDIGDHTLISHLGMSGSWRVDAHHNSEYLKHDHVAIHLADGRRLTFHDPRRFGLLLLAKLHQEQSNKWLARLGLEPLDENWSGENLKTLAAGKAVTIKSFIMDQTILVGVGNIYASEALFLAGIKPQRRVKAVKRHEWEKLAAVIRQVLSVAIASQGTTLRDYRQASGANGAFQERLQVYDRAGLPCRVCSTPIKLKTIVGRSTYWCPACQR